jgi:hypothetical protein
MIVASAATARTVAIAVIVLAAANAVRADSKEI